jgi:guanylate kinase
LKTNPGQARSEGFLLVVDGPSAVGKSTIVRGLLDLPDIHFDVIKRYTTRSRRESDDDEDLYEFIPQSEFQALAARGAFLEHKCYKFGMCYALPLKETSESLGRGNHAVAMINLGNIGAVRSAVPNTFGVFVTASLDTIKERLLSRKTHPPDQVSERLGNAADSNRFLPFYDLVVMNEGRNVSEVVEEIKKQFLSRVRKEAKV